MTTDLDQDEPLHAAWWDAMSAAATFQTLHCGCWPPTSCERCEPLNKKVDETEQALREAGQWL